MKCDTLNIIAPILTYLFMITGNVIFFFAEIENDLSNPVKIVELTVFEVLLTLTIWSHLRTACTAPGYV